VGMDLVKIVNDVMQAILKECREYGLLSSCGFLIRPHAKKLQFGC
jgi:hypothetical protein